MLVRDISMPYRTQGPNAYHSMSATWCDGDSWCLQHVADTIEIDRGLEHTCTFYRSDNGLFGLKYLLAFTNTA
jgi:hypothetical protein